MLFAAGVTNRGLGHHVYAQARNGLFCTRTCSPRRLGVRRRRNCDTCGSPSITTRTGVRVPDLTNGVVEFVLIGGPPSRA